MDEILARFWNNLIDRWSGPLSLRLYLQPAMATMFAIRDGLGDARGGRPAYLWSIFTQPEERGRLIRDGFRAVGKIILLAIVLDFVYQVMVFRWIHPIELLDVVLILAVLPYCLLRGPTNRIARWWMGR